MNTLFDRIQDLQFGWRDAIDIVLVAFIIYNVLMLIRGTRAMQMSIGLLILGFVYFVAAALDLVATETLSREILFYLPFVIIVLFQHEIRRALASFGKYPLVSWFARPPEMEPLNAVVDAAAELSRRRIGGLIAIERTQNLRAYVETGKPLDAVVSSDLLLNIFTPNTPLHDGAVIIQGNRIAAASTFLPLSANLDGSDRHGSRHRAALGLAEETDAFVVVNSEENGAIAVALEGRLHEDLTPDQLRRLCTTHLFQYVGREA